MKPSNSHQHLRRQVLAGLAVLALPSTLAACAGVLPGQGPPPRLFRLTPKSTFPPDLPTADWQLVIEVPVTPAGLNTTRIALHRRAIELQHYARANWTDRAPAMAQTLVVESFENSARIIAVGRESLGLRADFILKMELREFQAEYDGATPSAHVEINAKLVQMPQRSIIAARRFGVRAPAHADRIEDIVTAFDAALGKVLKALVSWTLIEGDKAHRARR
jgi:cholesterol transport system auxiliary component